MIGSRSRELAAFLALFLGWSIAPDALRAQVDPYTWVHNESEVLRFDRNGTLVSQTSSPATDGLRMQKAADGRAWVFRSLQASATEVYVLDGNGVVSAFNVPFFQGVAAHPSGGMWVLSRDNLSGISTLEIRDAQGAVIGTPYITPIAYTQITGGGQGGVWIWEQASLGSMRRFDDAGQETGVGVMPSVPPHRFLADLQGRLWMNSGTSNLRVYAPTGQVLVDQALLPISLSTGLLRLVHDARGEVRALVASNEGFRLQSFDPVTLTRVAGLPMTLPSGWTPATRPWFDELGQIWCASPSGALHLLAADGSYSRHVYTDPVDHMLDVTTGTRMAALVLPNVDSDGDGHGNLEEIALGSHCFDAVSQPLSFLPDAPLAPGQITTFTLLDGEEGGRVFLTAASFTPGATPVSFLYPQVLPMAWDGLSDYWFSSQNAVAPLGVSGMLDANGLGSFSLFVPAQLTGASFQLSAATFDATSGAPRLFSPALSLTLP